LNYRRKKILVSWYTNPLYIPPFTLTGSQVTVGPRFWPDQRLLMYSGWTPVGSYDLREALQRAALPTEYDAIVVWADARGSNFPMNLGAFDCPKVLCVGDTHHMKTPLDAMLSYAIRARYDFILSSHNRQHLHWFTEAGFANVAWIPGLKVRHVPRPIGGSRKGTVAFIGGTGDFHPRRKRLLAELERQGAPLSTAVALRDPSADVYASSAVSFNASLNGDLNLRVFEILSAGGCLLTDRLSRESGLDLLLKEGRVFLAYDTPEECVDQARMLLKNPEAALDLSRHGHQTFVQTMLPEQRTSELLNWVFEGRLDSLFRVDQQSPREGGGANLNDRVRVYQELQELHRLEEAPQVLFTADVPAAYLADVLDLSRLRLFIGCVDDRPFVGPSQETQQRYTVADRNRIESTIWDCVVATEATALPPPIRSRQVLRSRPRPIAQRSD
jgi:hypothetical protein